MCDALSSGACWNMQFCAHLTSRSAVGQPAIPQERNLVEALAKSPDTVTFIPSAYVNNWTDEQLADHPRMDHVHAHNSASGKRAEELGLGVTRVYAGLFAEFFFEYASVEPAFPSTLLVTDTERRVDSCRSVSRQTLYSSMPLRGRTRTH